MEKFTVLHGKAVPMMRANINTDDIIAAQAMAGKVERIGERLFTGQRYDLEGRERPDFILNTPRYRGARILLAGANFGCGSSREAAVWALVDYGIRCVIAPSYGEIFHDNSYQNGLLPVVLEETLVRRLAAAVEAADEPEMTVDLEQCRIGPPVGEVISFSISNERREALLAGKDELDVLLSRQPELHAWRDRAGPAFPWIWPDAI
jgi:3-isopropylmalate/(R)-2-methylmalate dehydratase small subunit